MNSKENLEDLLNRFEHACRGGEYEVSHQLRGEIIKHVQWLEKEFERYDLINHNIGMAVSNTSISDEEKRNEVNKLLSEAWEGECIHCNGKGFNGLDYCPYCVRGKMLKENLELDQQNKRYHALLESIRYTHDMVGEIIKKKPNATAITPDDFLQHMLDKVNKFLDNEG